MIVSDEKKFIFIHNPKTAGESIEFALKPHASLLVSAPKNLHRVLNKHSSPVAIKKYVGNKRWNKYFKFAFVRNPWDRLVSLYVYARGRKEGTTARRLSFEDFVKHRIQKNKQFIMQRSYFKNKQGSALDFVGQFENIDSDFIKICNKINITCLLTHKNKSKHRHYREYYTPVTRDLVKSISKEEIDLFGYVF